MTSDFDTRTYLTEKRMNIIIIVVAVTAGVILGGTAYMFIRENADRKNLSYWQNV